MTEPAPVALLLTDVVDSTQLAERSATPRWPRCGPRTTASRATCCPLWRGREIDKTDGMLLLFDSAADAVGYALAYHRALAALAAAAEGARRAARRAR